MPEMAERKSSLVPVALSTARPQAQPEQQQQQPQQQQQRKQQKQRQQSVPEPKAPAKWRFVQQGTMKPSKEFITLLDLLFDDLDATVEPRNTGRFEASKMVEVFKFEMTGNADGLSKYMVFCNGSIKPTNSPGRSLTEVEILAQDSYRAVGIFWSLLYVPHILIPTTPFLVPGSAPFASPNQTQPQNQPEQDASSALLSIFQANKQLNHSLPTSYTPALDRAAFHAFFFIFAHSQMKSFLSLVRQRCPSYNKSIHPDIDILDITESDFRRLATDSYIKAFRTTLDIIKGPGAGGPVAGQQQQQQEHMQEMQQMQQVPQQQPQQQPQKQQYMAMPPPPAVAAMGTQNMGMPQAYEPGLNMQAGYGNADWAMKY